VVKRDAHRGRVNLRDPECHSGAEIRAEVEAGAARVGHGPFEEPHSSDHADVRLPSVASSQVGDETYPVHTGTEDRLRSERPFWQACARDARPVRQRDGYHSGRVVELEAGADQQGDSGMPELELVKASTAASDSTSYKLTCFRSQGPCVFTIVSFETGTTEVRQRSCPGRRKLLRARRGLVISA
jgi:hypothetical protein